jgi:Na+/H+-dicarboxylate symporter
MENPSTEHQKWFIYCDYSFCFIFIAEMVIKVLGLGFFGTTKETKRYSYFGDAWNRLDAFVVLISIICLIPVLGNLKMLRSFRAIRPLRLVARSDNAKIILSSLKGTIPQIINVSFFLLLIYSTFSIVLMHELKG